jgi:hypothetical protein
MIEPLALASAQESIQSADSSESTLVPAPIFIENVYGDGPRSRAATPMIVRPDPSPSVRSSITLHLPAQFPASPPVTTSRSLRLVSEAEETIRLKQR